MQRKRQGVGVSEFKWEEYEAAPSKTESAIAGAKTGIKSLGYGLEQLALIPPPSTGLYGAEDEAQWFERNVEPLKESINKKGMANEAEFQKHYEENPWTSMLSRGATEGIATAPFAMEAQAAKIPGYLARMGQATARGAREGARGGAAIGGLAFTPEDESRGLNAMITAGIGGGIGGGLGASGAAINPFNIAQSFRGSATDAQMLENLRAAEGTETSLGRILGNSWLTDLSENMLSYVPFSGARKSQTKTMESLEKKAEGALSNLSGGKTFEDVDLGEVAQKSLQKTAQGKREISSENYTAISDLANELGLKFDTGNVKETSKEILRELNKTPLLAERAKKKYGSLIDDLERYSGMEKKSITTSSEYKTHKTNEQISSKRNTGGLFNDETQATREVINYEPRAQEPGVFDYAQGKFTPEKSLPKETIESLGILRSNMGEDAWKALTSGERYESGKYSQMQKAFDRDINQIIEESGNEELKSMGKNAKDYFIKEIVPLNKPRMMKYINDPQLENSDTIFSDFIRQGKIDRPKITQSFMNNLGQEGQEAARAGYFGGPRMENDAKAMASQYNKIGPKTLEALVPDAQIRQQVGDVANLARMNPQGFLDMFNPKTGAKSLFMEGLKLAGGATLSGLSVLNPVTAAFVPLAYGINEALTSPTVRKNIVKELSRSGDRNQSEIMKRLGNALTTTGRGLATAPKRNKESQGEY